MEKDIATNSAFQEGYRDARGKLDRIKVAQPVVFGTEEYPNALDFMSSFVDYIREELKLNPLYQGGELYRKYIERT